MAEGAGCTISNADVSGRTESGVFGWTLLDASELEKVEASGVVAVGAVARRLLASVTALVTWPAC